MNLTSILYFEIQWLDESLPTNCFDKNRTKLTIPLEFTMDQILILQNYDSYSFSLTILCNY